MSEIPADVMEAARKFVGQPVYGQDLTISDVIATYIARAIMAERERCANVAALYLASGGTVHPDVPADSMSDTARNVAHATCQCVAAAIRGIE